jgi:hypothetical protein
MLSHTGSRVSRELDHAAVVAPVYAYSLLYMYVQIDVTITQARERALRGKEETLRADHAQKVGELQLLQVSILASDAVAQLL